MKRTVLGIILRLTTLTLVEWAACGTLALGLSLAGIVTPFLHEQLRSQGDRLHALERAYQRTRVAPTTDVNQEQQRLDRFYSVLVPEGQLEQTVGRLFELAGQAGVILEKADYRLAADKTGQYRTYQIDLPIKASYPAVLAFCERVLTELPFASLDAVRFRRDKVSSGQIAATIRLTFFVSSHPSLPSPHRSSTVPKARLIAEAAK